MTETEKKIEVTFTRLIIGRMMMLFALGAWLPAFITIPLILSTGGNPLPIFVWLGVASAIGCVGAYLHYTRPKCLRCGKEARVNVRQYDAWPPGAYCLSCLSNMRENALHDRCKNCSRRGQPKCFKFADAMCKDIVLKEE